MASGTQGYQNTSSDKSLADTLIEEYKKLRKRRKSGEGSDNPIDPVNIKFVQDSIDAVDKFIISGANSLLALTGRNNALEIITPDDPLMIMAGEELQEEKKQTLLLKGQNDLIGKFIEIKRDEVSNADRLRKESRLEDEEFLSGTQGWKNKKKEKKDCSCNDGLLGSLADILQVLLLIKGGAGVKTAVAANALRSLQNRAFNTQKNRVSSNANVKTNLNKNVDLELKNQKVNLNKTNLGNSKSFWNRRMINITPLYDDLQLKGDNMFNTRALPFDTRQKFDFKNSYLKDLELDYEPIKGSNRTQFQPKTNYFQNSNQNQSFNTNNTFNNTAKEGTKDLVEENLDELINVTPGNLTKNQTQVKPKFNWKAFLNRANPRNLKNVNWKNVGKGGLVSILAGFVTGALKDWRLNTDAHYEALGIKDEEYEKQREMISKLIDDLNNEKEWKKTGWFRLQQALGFVLDMASFGTHDTRIGDRKIQYIHTILQKLEESGINFREMDVDVPMNNDQYQQFIDSLDDKNIDTNDDSQINKDLSWVPDTGVEVASTDLTGVLAGTGNEFNKISSNKFFQTSNKNTTGTLKGLTAEDYKWLAYAISGEARLGTDDIYGVAASILNRYARGDGTIEEIIKADGQYEAYEKGRMTHSPDIASLLQSKDGQQKLMEALQVLNGRTEFKGQSMIHNRVELEDPMFNKLGNFFHYDYQDSSDSVKPEGWKPVNWQQFIPGTEVDNTKGVNNQLSEAVATLSRDTSDSPIFVFIPASQQQVASAQSNEQSTVLSTSSIPIENKLLDLYKFNSFQRLVG